MSRRSRILVVDDSPVVRRLVSLALGGVGGFDVLAVADAAAALSVLADDAEGFSAVVVDATLPDLSGLELVERMRSDQELRRVGVVLLAGRDAGVDAQRAKALGVAEVVRKPFDPASLRRALRAVALTRESASTAAAMPVDAQALLDSIPHAAMVLDRHHRVVMANTAFWQATGHGIDDCVVDCRAAMHASGEAPEVCPLRTSVTTGERVEVEVCEPELGQLLVSVYPIEAVDDEGDRLYLHLTRPVDEA